MANTAFDAVPRLFWGCHFEDVENDPRASCFSSFEDAGSSYSFFQYLGILLLCCYSEVVLNCAQEQTHRSGMEKSNWSVGHVTCQGLVTETKHSTFFHKRHGNHYCCYSFLSSVTAPHVSYKKQTHSFLFTVLKHIQIMQGRTDYLFGIPGLNRKKSKNMLRR